MDVTRLQVLECRLALDHVVGYEMLAVPQNHVPSYLEHGLHEGEAEPARLMEEALVGVVRAQHLARRAGQLDDIEPERRLDPGRDAGFQHTHGDRALKTITTRLPGMSTPLDLARQEAQAWVTTLMPFDWTAATSYST